MRHVKWRIVRVRVYYYYYFFFYRGHPPPPGPICDALRCAQGVGVWAHVDPFRLWIALVSFDALRPKLSQYSWSLPYHAPYSAN